MPTNQSATICSVYRYSQQCVVYIDNMAFKQQKVVGESQKAVQVYVDSLVVD